MTTTAFTPLASLIGGGLIGLAAVALMASTGRIAGVSGILARLLPPYADSGFLGRLAFVLSLVAAPLVLWLATGQMPAPQIETPLPALLLAGVLVGFGAVWGYGCTSGHGVCGLARLSPASLIATLIFLSAAMATTFITRHLL